MAQKRVRTPHNSCSAPARFAQRGQPSRAPSHAWCSPPATLLTHVLCCAALSSVEGLVSRGVGLAEERGVSDDKFYKGAASPHTARSVSCFGSDSPPALPILAA